VKEVFNRLLVGWRWSNYLFRVGGTSCCPNLAWTLWEWKRIGSPKLCIESQKCPW